MKLLMISGDRSLQEGRKGAFFGLLEEFHTHWDRVDILCPRSYKPQATSHQQSTLQPFLNVFVHIGSSSFLRQMRFITKKGSELFTEHHHDVMTVHEYPPFYNGLGARKLMRKTGIPANLEIHHLVGFPRPASWQERIGRMMSTYYLGRHSRSFTSVRTVNREVLEAIVGFGVERKKISVVPSVYLDHTLYDGLSSMEKKYDLVFCGRLVPNKGLFPVLQAMEELPEKTLLVIGDGPELPQAREYVLAKNLEHRVTFFGWLPDGASVMRGIASGKIFVMNSASEGNPRVAVEAMAAGLPVLSTRVGIMPDIVKEGVHGVFTDGTAHDIALKAAALLKDPLKSIVMGEEAKTVMVRFEKKTAIKAYADFLKSFARP